MKSPIPIVIVASAISQVAKDPKWQHKQIVAINMSSNSITLHCSDATYIHLNIEIESIDPKGNENG